MEVGKVVIGIVQLLDVQLMLAFFEIHRLYCEAAIEFGVFAKGKFQVIDPETLDGTFHPAFKLHWIGHLVKQLRERTEVADLNGGGEDQGVETNRVLKTVEG